MNIIDEKLVSKAARIFDSPEKWSAFLELDRLRSSITTHWLTIGTKKLRDHFTANPSPGWNWKIWDTSTDTRWYLEKFGPGSLGIGFGWNYEFHLFLNDGRSFDSDRIDQLLKTSNYAELLTDFDPNSPVQTRPRSKARKFPEFTFVGLNINGTLPIDELAWYAAHQSEAFVKEAACMIERFTRNDRLTSLLSEINEQAQINPKRG